MQTECPHCHTIFRVNQEMLEQANGQLRCGFCMAIFSTTTNNAHHDIKLDSNENSEPDVNLADIEPVLINTADKPVLADVIPPELRAETRSPKKHYGYLATSLWSLGIIFAILIGLLQYAYYDRLQLVQHNELRPWLVLMCNYAKCDLPEPRDTNQIELSSKNIFTHPNTANALMISVTIVNQAEFEQAFPQLELRFEDIRGKIIAGRRFKPKEYLGIPNEQISKMEPGNPVSFTIEIVDPGTDIISYEFDFL